VKDISAKVITTSTNTNQAAKPVKAPHAHHHHHVTIANTLPVATDTSIHAPALTTAEIEVDVMAIVDVIVVVHVLPLILLVRGLTLLHHHGLVMIAVADDMEESLDAMIVIVEEEIGEAAVEVDDGTDGGDLLLLLHGLLRLRAEQLKAPGDQSGIPRQRKKNKKVQSLQSVLALIIAPILRS